MKKKLGIWFVLFCMIMYSCCNMVYAAEDNGELIANGSSDTEFSTTIDSSFVLLIPKVIHLDSNTYDADYNVIMKHCDIYTKESVVVSSPTSFDISKKNATDIAVVNNDMLKSTDDIESCIYFTGVLTDDARTGHMESEKLSAGDWETGVTFYVNVDGESIDGTERHAWRDTFDSTTATCTEPGISTFSCRFCNASKTAPQDALGCSYDEDEQCVRCGNVKNAVTEEINIYHHHSYSGNNMNGNNTNSGAGSYNDSYYRSGSGGCFTNYYTSSTSSGYYTHPTCTTCNGAGVIVTSTTCSWCHGKGTSNTKICTVCNGSGSLRCPQCQGSGTYKNKTCSNCKGSGALECSSCNGRGKRPVATYTCPDCNGSGSVSSTTSCSTCGGDGKTDVWHSGSTTYYYNCGCGHTDGELLATITVNLNGGSVSPLYTESSGTITLNNPTRDGFTFMGWITDDDTTPNKSVTISERTDLANRTYKATWKRN